MNKPKNTSYQLVINSENKIVFKTVFKEVSLITNEALYFIVPDFNYYQHFYKVQPNNVVLDAGANCGHLSIFFSKLVGKNGIVYAFEPDTFNIKRINSNKQLNNDLLDNIRIEELLLWNENKLVDFYEAGTVGSSAVWIPDTDKCVKKEAVRIDHWVTKNNIKKLDFIKMDIEGAEIEALDGCVQTIENLKPNFAIASYHIVEGAATYIKVEEFFKKMNYPYKTVRFRKNEIITFAGASVNQ
ncbi:FkbM family methyltransferase [Flavobacterium franklandianum]|uniref:FkbM family methyltransferase n=1 Tax=Flavobacterium franklandianum TaxID=2594430 RepID=A0A553CKD6_9FLAO|nr:FkbM family methyltransferase [Flavobacterium franklandianum]